MSSLVAEWKPILDELEDLSSNLNKSVIFTEIGFPVGSGLRNYHPTQADYQLQVRNHLSGLHWFCIKHKLQANQYEAVFDATSGRQWFLGCFWWNWDTDPGALFEVLPSLSLSLSLFFFFFFFFFSRINIYILFTLAFAVDDDCFTPQWKPAASIVRTRYGGSAEPPHPNIAPQCLGYGKCTS